VQPAARITQSVLVLDHFNGRHAGIAIEPVRISNERPELLGRRFEIEFPFVMKFAHRVKTVSGFKFKVSSPRDHLAFEPKQLET